jgi:hypothetical protein
MLFDVIINLRISVPDPDWIRNQAGQNRPPPKKGKNLENSCLKSFLLGCRLEPESYL